MAYKQFSIGPDKGLALASLSKVPNLMVIVGPNGAGKSTLLFQLKEQAAAQAEANSKVLYLNPNRPWRRTTFNAGVINNLPYSMSDLYAMTQFPGFQQYVPSGFSQSGLPRSPDNPDDTQGLIKFMFAKLNERRRRAIVDAYDANGGSIASGSIPNAFLPVQEMVSQLLPHLRFTGVTDSSGENITCTFEKIDGSAAVALDIDDLSSGEKAVFQLLLPFLETQVEALIGAPATNTQMVTAIIDEPELHLHPSLQIALLSYLRTLASKGSAQFILATHSTAIMDACEEDELYLLASPASVSGGNQLLKLAASNDRLETVRELTGSTYAITRCRPIVYLEGHKTSASRDITDERLLEMLVPESRGWVIVPGTSRAEVIKQANALREPSLTEIPGMPVFALVDKDTSTSTPNDFTISWPVCMVENLLLDAAAIWKVLQPHREAVGLTSEAAVLAELNTIASSRIDEEISLRLNRSFKPFRFYRTPTTPEDVDALETRFQDELRSYRESFPSAAGLEASRQKIRLDVENTVATNQQLNYFHGKEILRQFFDKFGRKVGTSYAAFAYGIASHAADGTRLRGIVEVPIRKITQFVPADLPSALLDMAPVIKERYWKIDQIAATAVESRSHWEAGTHDPCDRAALRHELFQLAVFLRSVDLTALNHKLYELTPLLGVSTNASTS